MSGNVASFLAHHLNFLHPIKPTSAFRNVRYRNCQTGVTHSDAAFGQIHLELAYGTLSDGAALLRGVSGVIRQKERRSERYANQETCFRS